MSEQSTESATQVDQAGTEQGNPDEAALGDPGKKALDAMKAERNQAKLQATELQKQLDAINQANESAIEKANRVASEAAENARTATVAAFRQAAVKFGGISAEDADLFLTGADIDTLEKQAARLADRTSTGPKPDLSQGTKGAAAPSDPAQIFANFMKQI